MADIKTIEIIKPILLDALRREDTIEVKRLRKKCWQKIKELNLHRERKLSIIQMTDWLRQLGQQRNIRVFKSGTSYSFIIM